MKNSKRILLCLITLALSVAVMLSFVSCDAEEIANEAIAMITDIEAEIDANKAELDAKIDELKAEYRAKDDALTAEIEAGKADLAELKAKYDADLKALTDADAANATAVAELSAAYEAKMTALDAADKANADELAALKEQYNKDLAALNNADKANAEAIENLDKKYADEVKKLEDASGAIADELAALKAQYEKDLAALNNADKANAEAIENLDKKYADEVKKLEDAGNATADELAALKAQYEKDLAELNNADKANAEAIENLDKKYADEVKKLEDAGNATADELAALKGQYEKDLAALNNADKANAEAIENLDKKYADEVKKLEDAGNATADELSALKAQYEKDLAALNNADKANAEAIENLDKKYADEVKKLEDASGAIADELAALRAQYEKDLAALNSADEANDEAIKALKATYEKKVAAIDASIVEVEGVIKSNKNALQSAIDTLTSSYNTKVAELEGLIDEIRAADAEQNGKIKDLEDYFNEKLQKIEADFAEREAGYQAAIKELEDRIEELEKVTTYTVKFDTDGGVAVEDAIVVAGKKVAMPTDPTKAGYDFLGWYFGDERWSFIGYVVSDDMTLTARWNVKEYSLKVNDELNGDYTLYFTVESNSFTLPTPMSTPIKKFIGWQVGESSELVSEFTLEKGTAESVVITARFEDVECIYHVDYDVSGYCDYCDKYVVVEDCEHKDENGDTRCDACGGCIHEDIDGDYSCELCGAHISNKIVMKPLWDSANIIMQLNNCSNNGELSSGLARYLAGDTSYYNSIDKAVAKRNIAATEETKVSVTYKYWDDDSAMNGWGDTIDHIDSYVNSTTIKEAPDVYSTYIYDMVACSIKGYFANLKGTVRGSGKTKGVNYFEFVYDKYNYEKEYKESVENDRGFMYEWMESVTLDPNNRMYLLASDYYVDMVRAFFMIPVNRSILEEIANHYPELTGDRNGDGAIDLKDFYEQVRAGEWTYSLMMEYSKAAYQDDGNSITVGKWLGDKQVGFAMSDGGVANSGIIYTSSIKVIHKEWNTDRNDYDYYYPGSNKDPNGKEEGLTEFANGFGKLVDAIEELLESEGVVLVKREYCSGKTWNDISYLSTNTEHQAIRVAFGQGSVLFGDITMLGNLEYSEYQRMGENGFGVLPVPIYHDNIDEDGNVIDKCLTQIHNMGRPGAIAYNTKKFVECTAFLNYQSTNSEEVLSEYFANELCYSRAGGNADTVEMLEYLRDNVRTSFDKAMEDAMGVFDYEATEYKITYILSANDFVAPNLETDYAMCVNLKQGYLDTLVNYFKNAKD